MNGGGIREYESPIVVSKEGSLHSPTMPMTVQETGNSKKLRGAVVLGKLLFEDSFDEYGLENFRTPRKRDISSPTRTSS